MGRVQRTSAGITSALTENDYLAFQVGDAVMTLDGLPGVVVGATAGPFGAAYEVELDNGLGGGDYDESQLAPIQDASISTEASRDDDPPEYCGTCGHWTEADDLGRANSDCDCEAPGCPCTDDYKVRRLARRYTGVPLVCDGCGATATHSTAGGLDGHTNRCPECAKQPKEAKTAYYSPVDESLIDESRIPKDWKKDYNLGWKSGMGGSYDALGRADQRGVSVYWKMGFHDAAGGETKFRAFWDKDWGAPMTTVASRTAARADLPLADPGTVRVASDDYPEFEDILWTNPDHIEAKPVSINMVSLTSKTAAKQTIGDTIADPDQPWWWRGVVGPAVNRVNDRLAPEWQTDDIGMVPDSSNRPNWCRFRREGHCFFPKELDEQGSKDAGYAVWIPFDRGACLRSHWTDQRACELGEPGPNSGESTYGDDGTRRWRDGGQRFTVRHGSLTAAKLAGIEEQIAKVDAAMDACPYDYRIKGEERAREMAWGLYLENAMELDSLEGWVKDATVERLIDGAQAWSDDNWTEHMGSKTSGWFKKDEPAQVGQEYRPPITNTAPVAQEGECPSCFYPYGQHSPDCILRTTGRKTAAWSDVQAKGAEIRRNGGVRIIANTGTTVTAEIRGDKNVYVSSITRVPGTKQVGMWYCACDWNKYVWARSAPYKRFEGRQCSHSLALAWEIQSHEMFGGTIVEDTADPAWDLPMRQDRREGQEPEEYGLQTLDLTSALDTESAILALGNIRDSLLVAEESVEGESLGRVQALLATTASAESHLRSPDLGRVAGFKSQVGGGIKHVDGLYDDGTADVSGSEIDVDRLLYPTWDPSAGLHFSGAHIPSSLSTIVGVRHTASTHVGVMVALTPSHQVCEALHEYAAEAGFKAEPSSEIHMTLAYCGKPADVPDKDTFIANVRAWAAQHTHFTGKIGGIGTFYIEDGNALWATADIPGIAAARTSLMEALAVGGTPGLSSHDFIPHITLAYGKQPFTEIPDFSALAGTELIFTTVVAAWNGEWTHLDLVGSSGETVAVEHLDKAAAAKTAITMYHGTMSDRVDAIRQNGLTPPPGKGGMNGWYMLTTDYDQAARYSMGETGDRVVIEYDIPFERVFSRQHDGPGDLLWPAAAHNAYGFSADAYAPRGPIPAEYIKAVHKVGSKTAAARTLFYKNPEIAYTLCTRCVTADEKNDPAWIAVKSDDDSLRDGIEVCSECGRTVVNRLGKNADLNALEVLDAVLETEAGGDFAYAGLIIKALDSGRVLMTQRTPFHGDDEGAYGKWEFPGGGMDDGETTIEAAIREFQEETGLTLPDGWEIRDHLDNPKNQYMGLVVVVPSEAWTTDASLLTRETMGIGWFDIDQVPDIARSECADTDLDLVVEASAKPGLAVEAVGWNEAPYYDEYRRRDVQRWDADDDSETIITHVPSDDRQEYLLEGFFHDKNFGSQIPFASLEEAQAAGETMRPVTSGYLTTTEVREAYREAYGDRDADEVLREVMAEQEEAFATDEPYEDEDGWHDEDGLHVGLLLDDPEPVLEGDGVAYGSDFADTSTISGRAPGTSGPSDSRMASMGEMDLAALSAKLMANDPSGGGQSIQQYREDNADLARHAAAFLEKTALKVYSPAEQQALIEEGAREHLGASNTDMLNLTGTFYEQATEDDIDW